MDMGRSTIETILFDSEPECLAELEEERQMCEEASTIAEAEYLESLVVELLLPDARSNWGTETDENRPVRRKRKKAKAARDAPPNTESFEEEMSKLNVQEEASEENGIQLDDSPILFKQDSMSVFRKMCKAEDSNGGSVRWLQFVKAMEDAGFTARDIDGAGVSFLGEAGTIVLHKPHLVNPVIDPIRLQSWGKRMSRWFDWRLERFQIRQKE